MYVYIYNICIGGYKENTIIQYSADRVIDRRQKKILSEDIGGKKRPVCP